MYHVVVEGVLAETGYYGFGKALKSRGLLRGLVRGVEAVQRDEARKRMRALESVMAKQVT